MRMMKKLFAIALVAAMVMALGVTALAAGSNTIQVTSTTKDETYSVYKMMDLSVNTDKTAYRYTVTSEWEAFFTGNGAGAAYVDIDGNGYVTWKDGMDGADKMEAFSKAAAAYASGKTKAATDITGNGDAITFTGLEDGYYLVTSTLGVRAMALTTPADPNATVIEKNPEDTITKEVQEDSTDAWGNQNDAQVGQTVDFKSTATLLPNTRNVKIHDTMEQGLTYNNDVAIDGLTVDTDYIVQTTPDEGDTFTIQFTDTYLASLTGETKLTVTYSAVLNEKAVVSVEGVPVIDPQTNTTTITYGNKQSVESETTTTTHSFSVYKHATGKDTNLAGAVFSLKQDNAVVKLIKIDNNNYRVAKEGEEGAVDTFTTVASGDIVIWGVDADKYALREIQAPEGYNLLADEVEVTVDAGNATRADVENKSGTELPSTGGIGTKIFYGVGAVLVIGAGVVLMGRKRAAD